MTKSALTSRRNVLRMGGALGLMTVIRPAGMAYASEKETVRIVGTSGNLPSTLQHMVTHDGYLAGFGLEPAFSTVADGNRITGSIVSGEADVCMLSGFGQVPVAIEKGAKMKLIAGATLLLNQCVFAKRPDIKTVKDLQGKTVGVGSLGSLLHQLMVALLKKKGVDPSTVKFANVGNNTDVFRAVVAGVVDAGPSTIDVYDKQAEFGVHNLVDGEFWVQLPEYTQQASYAADAAIADKRTTLVKVLAAYAKLYRFLQTPESKDAFVKGRKAALGAKAQDSDSIFQWNWIQKYKPFATDLVLSEERIRYIENINIETGSQKKLLPMEQLADMSLARDALKLLA
jgi:ABC-type nitrate/sulfonate/bicarbonate transport system substrate-binding protein